MAGGRQKIWPKARRAANVMTGVLLLRTKRGGGCGECAGGGTAERGRRPFTGKVEVCGRRLRMRQGRKAVVLCPPSPSP